MAAISYRLFSQQFNNDEFTVSEAAQEQLP
jgi:hypothetical protein